MNYISAPSLSIRSECIEDIFHLFSNSVFFRNVSSPFSSDPKTPLLHWYYSIPESVAYLPFIIMKTVQLFALLRPSLLTNGGHLEFSPTNMLTTVMAASVKEIFLVVRMQTAQTRAFVSPKRAVTRGRF